MLYELVLITNLGVITPIATFNTQAECFKEKGMIVSTQQYSAACLPTNSPEEMAKRMNAGIKVLIDNINQLQEKTK